MIRKHFPTHFSLWSETIDSMEKDVLDFELDNHVWDMLGCSEGDHFRRVLWGMLCDYEET